MNGTRTHSRFALRAGLVTVALVAFGVLSTTNTAAQLRGRQIYDIPFGFSIGATHLPAGRYTITVHSQGVLKITGETGSTLFLARTEQVSKMDEKGSLVFHRYGDECFLSEVHSATDMTRAALTPSKVETAIAKRSNKQQETVTALVKP
jgi:hypothetical protein